MADESWEVLRTYEQVAADLKAQHTGTKEGSNDGGHAAFLQHAQRYGG